MKSEAGAILRVMKTLDRVVRVFLLIAPLAAALPGQAAQFGGAGEIKAWKLPSTFVEAAPAETAALKGFSMELAALDEKSLFDRQLAGMLVDPLRNYPIQDWRNHFSEVDQALADARQRMEPLIKAREEELRSAVMQRTHHFIQQDLRDAAVQMAKCRVFGGEVINESIRTVSDLANAGDLEKARLLAAALMIIQSVPAVPADPGPKPLARKHGRLAPAPRSIGESITQLILDDLGDRQYEIGEIGPMRQISNSNNIVVLLGAPVPLEKRADEGLWRMKIWDARLASRIKALLDAKGIVFKIGDKTANSTELYIMDAEKISASKESVPPTPEALAALRASIMQPILKKLGEDLYQLVAVNFNNRALYVIRSLSGSRTGEDLIDGWCSDSPEKAGFILVRALELLPAVESALRAQGFVFKRETTASIISISVQKPMK